MAFSYIISSFIYFQKVVAFAQHQPAVVQKGNFLKQTNYLNVVVCAKCCRNSVKTNSV